MRATWASVSALWTSTGRRPTRSGTDLSIRRVGQGRSLVRATTTRADSSPARTGPAGGARRSGTGSARPRCRSAMAASTESRPLVTVVGHADHDLGGAHHGGHHLGTVEDQVGRAGEQHPVLGAGRLALHGVDHHQGRRAGRRTTSHLAAAGKPAPPRPSSPEAATARTIRGPPPGSSPGGMVERAVGGQVGGQVRSGGVPPARPASSRPGASRVAVVMVDPSRAVGRAG